MLKNNIIETWEDIPESPRYVVATDSFMSGWGLATGKKNIVVCPCANATQAARVAQNLTKRSEMRDIHIIASKPILSSAVLYSLTDEKKCPKWYDAS